MYFDKAPFLLLPDWPGLPPEIGVATTCRRGGMSLPPYDDGMGEGGFNLGDHVGDNPEHVHYNRARLAACLPAPVQWLTQVHGTTVLELAPFQSHSVTADACFTLQPGVVCGVLTADCLPVLFCDPYAGIVAAAHAGWRGLVAGVLEATVARMLASGAKIERILSWMGPAIGPAHFEVGPEVRACFIDKDPHAAMAFVPNTQHPEKFLADLAQLAQRRLHRVGIMQIVGGGHCTMSEPETFYSYRRNGVTGRMASLIWMKK